MKYYNETTFTEGVISATDTDLHLYKKNAIKPGTVTFLDQSCGSGKTSDLLEGFKTTDRYFVVVVARSEIDRVIRDAVVNFSTPIEGGYVDADGVERRSLLIGLKDLIEDGENIVVTHTLFDRVSLNEFDLSGYHVIIDEVFDCVRPLKGPSADDFHKTYVGGGLATVADDGQIHPTDRWNLQGDGAYAFNLLAEAKRGRLFCADEGFYVTVVPTSLFVNSLSCTVLTYLAEGSLMAAYLRKHCIQYIVQKDEDKDLQARAVAKVRLKMEYVNLGLRTGLGYHRQGKLNRKNKGKIANKFKNLRSRQLKGVPVSDIMVTCRNDLWKDSAGVANGFAKDCRLAKAKWCHKSTKGTNDYRNCTHAIHLYDINLNPSVKKFLELTGEQEDLWRQSELIQWLYRTDLRNGDSDKPTELYMCSDKMMKLIENWLSESPMQ